MTTDKEMYPNMAPLINLLEELDMGRLNYLIESAQRTRDRLLYRDHAQVSSAVAFNHVGELQEIFQFNGKPLPHYQLWCSPAGNGWAAGVTICAGEEGMFECDGWHSSKKHAKQAAAKKALAFVHKKCPNLCL